MKSLAKCLTVAIFLAAVGCNAPSEQASQSRTPQIKTNPVFHTRITGNANSYPAIQVDIKDDSEDFFFTAELYLTIQSSRFPSDTSVVLPLNSGNFVGARSRFVQLPFEVQEGDTLLFNLLDNDKLNAEQEFVVPQTLPNSPQLANELCIRSSSNYVPAVLKIYGANQQDERTTQQVGTANLGLLAKH